MIIEHAFINNPYDRANYLNDNMLNKMAEADAKAIIENKELFRIDKTKNTVQAVLNNIYYDSNTGSVKGTLLYDELINNRVFDQTNPIVNLVSTDGRVKVQGSVTKDAAYTYSYDINIMNLDPYKEYVLQAIKKVFDGKADISPIEHISSHKKYIAINCSIVVQTNEERLHFFETLVQQNGIIMVI